MNEDVLKNVAACTPSPEDFFFCRLRFHLVFLLLLFFYYQKILVFHWRKCIETTNEAKQRHLLYVVELQHFLFYFYFLIQFPFTDDEIKENGVPKSSYFVSARSICFLFLHTQIYMKNPVSLQCVGDNLATMLSY